MEKINNLITVRQAAKLSGYNPDYISSLIRSGKIRGKKIGKNWLTTRNDVENYIQAIQEQSQFSKLSPQNRMVAQAVTWVRRQFSRSFKTVFLIIAFSILLALISYGIYAAIYQQAYTVAQSANASTTASGVVETQPAAVINATNFQ